MKIISSNLDRRGKIFSVTLPTATVYKVNKSPPHMIEISEYLSAYEVDLIFFTDIFPVKDKYFT